MQKTLSRLLAATAILAASALPFAAVAEDAAGQAVVAVVNGEKIFRQDVEESRFLLPQQFQQLPLEAVYGLLLNSLIDRKLTAASARGEGLAEDAEFKRQMARVEEQLLQRIYLTRYIEKKITDKVMQDGYQEFLKQAGKGREVRARHILTETREQAMEVIAALDKAGDFVELAKTRSKGPSGPNGGDLGYFDEGAMVPEFSKAAFAMKVGEYTKEPVQTQFGWHVIKVEDARTKEPPSFEEATPEIHADVSRKIGGELIDSLREKADIKRFRLDGSQMQEEKK